MTASTKVLSSAAALAATAVGATVLALTIQPSTSPPPVLPLPAAAVVKVMPGCAWGTGSKTLAIKRTTGQSFNMLNLTGQPRLFKLAAGDMSTIPMLNGYIPTGYAEAWTFAPQAAGRTMQITTCSGTVRLTVTVTATAT